ncbi:MAG: succinate dehydrogenase [Alteromonadaceae bacterium]|nr:MAG: succinate dehydrogenase [Alteromonadaceae bacterium]
MDDGLKQRLIGALVLLALAVIFIPMLFDNEGIEPVDRTTQIPIMDAVELRSVEITPVEPLKAPVKSAKEMYIPDKQRYLPDEKKVQDLRPKAISVTEKGLPVSWVLQVASYRYSSHAKGMRDKLIGEGYKAFVKGVDTERGNMTRLYVGPSMSKSSLIKQKKVIEKRHKVSTMLLRFKP